MSSRKYRVNRYVVPEHDRSFPRKKEPRCAVYIFSCGWLTPTGASAHVREAELMYESEAYDVAAVIKGSQVWRRL